MRIDLNCDLGELPGAAGRASDRAMMALVSSVNVACGAHAGDEATMRATVRAAQAAGTAIGAHPGYADRAGFGRRAVAAPPRALEDLVRRQIDALAAIAAADGAALRHVKPHGALYNRAARDRAAADAIVRAVAAVDAGLALVALAGSAMVDAGRDAGLAVVAEAFADRAYLADGALAPRSRPGAVLTDPAAVAARAVALVRDGRVPTLDGARLTLAAGTLCIHGDTPNAVRIAGAVRRGLEAAGIRVAPPPD